MRTPQKARKTIKNVKKQITSNNTVNLLEAQRQAGYSENSSLAYKVKTTEEWQKFEREEKPALLQKLYDFRGKVLDRMDSVIDQAKFRDLIRAFDISTKNYELLIGRPTERLEDPDPFSNYPVDWIQKMTSVKWDNIPDQVTERISNGTLREEDLKHFEPNESNQKPSNKMVD